MAPRGREEQWGGSGETRRTGGGQVVLTRGDPPCGNQYRPVGGAFRENLCREEASSAASIPVGAPRTCRARGRVNPECVCPARRHPGVTSA